MEPADALRAVLRESMPVAGRLGVTVVGYRDGVLSLAAPLDINVNDKGTAFAGSLAMLATLAGWSQVWLLLRERDLRGDIVLQDSSVKYLQPVLTDFIATTERPTEREIASCFDLLARRGKGRLKLDVTVAGHDGGLVKFTGRYVIARR